MAHQTDAVLTGVPLVPESINRPLVGCCVYWGTISPREYQSPISRMLFLLGYYQSPRVSIVHQSDAVLTGVLLVPESINRPLDGCCFNWGTLSPREYQSPISRKLFLLGYYQSQRVSIVHQTDAVLTQVLLVSESINHPLVGCCFYWGTISPRQYQSSISRMLFYWGTISPREYQSSISRMLF